MIHQSSPCNTNVRMCRVLLLCSKDDWLLLRSNGHVVECTRGVLPSGGAECAVSVPGPGLGPVPDPGPVPVLLVMLFLVFIVGLVTLLPLHGEMSWSCNIRVPLCSGTRPVG